jgi:hypothetical protein
MIDALSNGMLQPSYNPGNLENSIEAGVDSLGSEIYATASLVESLKKAMEQSRGSVKPFSVTSINNSQVASTSSDQAPSPTPLTPAVEASTGQEIPLNQGVSPEHVEQSPVAGQVAPTGDKLPSNAAHTDIAAIPVLPLAPPWIDYTQLNKTAAAPTPSKDSVNASGKLARVAKFSLNLVAATILASAALYAIRKYYSPEVKEHLAKILNPDQMEFVIQHATTVNTKLIVATQAVQEFLSSLSSDQMEQLSKLYQKYVSVLIPTIPREFSLTAEKLEFSKRYAEVARNSFVSSAGLFLQSAQEKTTQILGFGLSRAQEVVGRTFKRGE